ncbi:MAG: hypothetical protein ACXVGH_01845 [Mycobacteriales bacterium]
MPPSRRVPALAAAGLAGLLLLGLPLAGTAAGETSPSPSPSAPPPILVIPTRTSSPTPTPAATATRSATARPTTRPAATAAPVATRAYRTAATASPRPRVTADAPAPAVPGEGTVTGDYPLTGFASSSATPRAAAVRPAAAQASGGTDVLQLGGLAVGAAVLLGLGGAAGLYLTRLPRE